MQEEVVVTQEQKTGKGMRKARARKNFVFIPLIAVIAGAIAFSFAGSSGVSLITGNSISQLTPFAWLADPAVNSAVRWGLGIFLFVLIALVAVFLWFPGRAVKTSKWIVWKAVKTSVRSCFSLFKLKRR